MVTCLPCSVGWGSGIDATMSPAVSEGKSPLDVTFHVVANQLDDYIATEYCFDFGDGTTHLGTITDGSGEFNLSHTYYYEQGTSQYQGKTFNACVTILAVYGTNTKIRRAFATVGVSDPNSSLYDSPDGEQVWDPVDCSGTRGMVYGYQVSGTSGAIIGSGARFNDGSWSEYIFISPTNGIIGTVNDYDLARNVPKITQNVTWTQWNTNIAAGMGGACPNGIIPDDDGGDNGNGGYSGGETIFPNLSEYWPYIAIAGGVIVIGTALVLTSKRK